MDEEVKEKLLERATILGTAGKESAVVGLIMIDKMWLSLQRL